MASVQELLALANAKAGNGFANGAAGPLEAAAQGVSSAQSNNLDMVVKLVKLQQLQKEMQAQEDLKNSVAAQLAGNQAAATHGVMSKATTPEAPASPAGKLKWKITQDAKGEFSRTLEPTKDSEVYTPEQVNAIFPHTDPEKIRTAFPNGVPKDALPQFGSESKSEFSLGIKEDQFYQKEWDKIQKNVDPLTASPRTGLGMAVLSDFKANRAVDTLASPTVTNQDAGNVMADIASIYQNGSPTTYGMSHQAYNSLYGMIQGARQTVTGKPQDALPDAIKQKLISTLNTMKDTNRAVLKQHFDGIEKSQPKVISRFKDEWKGLRDNYAQGVSGGKADPGNKILVSNGKETLKIDPTDEADAAKDGYTKVVHELER